MTCSEDCFFLLGSACSIGALINGTDTDECAKAVSCINDYTYAAIALVVALTVQVIMLIICLLFCYVKAWKGRKTRNIHVNPSSDTEEIKLTEMRTTGRDNSMETRDESDAGGGWYDTLANATTKDPEPMHYQPDMLANEQLEANYDVIRPSTDVTSPNDSESFPVFSVEGFYAEVSKSEMEERKKCVQEKSKGIDLPATIEETCEEIFTPEYAVVNKPKKRKSVDNLANPPNDTDVPPPLPSPLPLITVSCENEAEQCKSTTEENEKSPDQCKEASSENPNVMPTCNVLPLWPTSTPTTDDTCLTED